MIDDDEDYDWYLWWKEDVCCYDGKNEICRLMIMNGIVVFSLSFDAWMNDYDDGDLFDVYVVSMWRS